VSFDKKFDGTFLTPKAEELLHQHPRWNKNQSYADFKALCKELDVVKFLPDKARSVLEVDCSQSCTLYGYVNYIAVGMGTRQEVEEFRRNLFDE